MLKIAATDVAKNGGSGPTEGTAMGAGSLPVTLLTTSPLSPAPRVLHL